MSSLETELRESEDEGIAIKKVYRIGVKKEIKSKRKIKPKKEVKELNEKELKEKEIIEEEKIDNNKEEKKIKKDKKSKKPKKTKEEKALEKEKKKDLEKTIKNVKQETIDMIPILELTEEEYFKTKTGFLDIVQVESMDIDAMNGVEANTTILSFTYLLKSYVDDMKIISMNFPTNTLTQREYLSRAIRVCKNREHLHFLNNRMSQLEAIEKLRSNREFFIMIFSETEREMESNRSNILNNFKKIKVFEVDVEKKVKILKKLNNMNSKI